MNKDRAIHTDADVASMQQTCDRCGRSLRKGRAFAFKAGPARPSPSLPAQVNEIAKCILCALLHPPMLRRSMLAAALVGTMQTLVNQGDVLLDVFSSGQWAYPLFWKIPLTYSIPFGVATFGALTICRR